jgi:hypothetical protein
VSIRSRETILGLPGFWCGWAESGEEVTLDELLTRYDPATLRLPGAES